MNRKLRLSLLALAATATMAATALAPSTASAWGRVGGYHLGGRGLGLHTGLYHFNHYRFGWGFNHYRFGWRYPICYWGSYCHPYRWHGWYRWFPRRGIVYGGLGAIGGAAAIAATPAMSAPAAAQPAQPANCLVKQYLPNGAVAFADTCTNEQAVSMPNGAPLGQPAAN